jgi:hypothetical protein
MEDIASSFQSHAGETMKKLVDCGHESVFRMPPAGKQCKIECFEEKEKMVLH